jgi:hypothetical protein
MDKDANLFEDVIKENSDLLDIGLDDLSDDAGDEAKGEEADEGIIDLLDLVEKGDADLFSNDELMEEDIITYEPIETSDEESGILTEEKDELDDIMLETDISAPADDLGINLDEDMPDQLLQDDNVPDDADNALPDQDISGDMFEKLLDDTVLDELSEDSVVTPLDIEEFNLEPEDFSDLETVLEEEPISDEKVAESPAPAGIQGNLFRDFDPVASAPEETHVLDDELIAEPDIFGDELEKAIASSDDVTNEKSLWDTDTDDKTMGAETEGVSILEETASDDEKIKNLGMDSSEESYVHLDDIQLDSKSIDSLFPDEGITEDVAGASVSDDSLQVESQDLLPSDMDQPETSLSEESVVPEIQATDNLAPVDDTPSVPAETIVQSIISEERIEEIVTKVVGEVVERVAREVFKDVAEKVISEAIEGLKKSLEAELE